MEFQIISIHLANEGAFDPVPVEDVRRYEAELHETIRSEAPEVYEQIDGGAALSDESKETLARVNERFAQNFQTTEGEHVVREPEAKALDEDDVSKNQLNVSRKSQKKDG